MTAERPLFELDSIDQADALARRRYRLQRQIDEQLRLRSLADQNITVLRAALAELEKQPCNS